MAILAIYRSKDISPSQFESYRARVPLDESPPGALVHYYARSKDDGSLCVVDLWDDPAAMARFGEEQIKPALRALDLPYIEPELFDVQTIAVVGPIEEYRVALKAQAVEPA